MMKNVCQEKPRITGSRNSIMYKLASDKKHQGHPMEVTTKATIQRVEEMIHAE